jgi:hypothetical protein
MALFVLGNHSIVNIEGETDSFHKKPFRGGLMFIKNIRYLGKGKGKERK